jgi:soluble lytic murein transglycosylase-like protein
VRARDRSPDRYRRYDAHIREAATLYRLPETFIRAVMRVESDFSPNVVSHAGAMGLMQLMPRTARAMGVRDPFNPRQNILGGTRYLRILANKFSGDLVLTIAGYNAGEGAVIRYRGVPPYRETRRYVQRVLRYYYAFRAAEGGQPRAGR